MTSIKQLKEKYSIDLNSFEEAKRNYYTFCKSIDNPDFDVEKSKEAYKALCGKFEHIFRICANEAKVAENAEISYSPQKGVIPKVGFSTETTNVDFAIGLFRDFYIVTELKSPHNIKLMKDEFWQLLFKLSSIGKFRFSENEKPTDSMRKKAPQLFNKQDNYFKILRNYFLNEMQYGQIRSLGFISVSWDNDTSFDKLIVNFCEAFKAMYQMNLLLWRPDNKKARL